MKHGARNDIVGRVSSIVEGGVMAQAKVEISGDFTLASVMTRESVAALDLKEGDEVHLVVKAIHVLVVKP